MATTSSSLRFADPRQFPLLREYERVSPATELVLSVGSLEDGWDDLRVFAVGTLFQTSRKDVVYKVVGFSLDNHIFAAPYGLGHQPSVRCYEFGSADGLTIVEQPVTFWSLD